MSESEQVMRICPITKEECIVPERCAIFDCHRTTVFLGAALDQFEGLPFVQARINPDDWADTYGIPKKEFRDYITNLRSRRK